MGCAASCDGGTTTDTKSSTTAIVSSSVATGDLTNLSIPQPRPPPPAPFATVVKPVLVHHPPVRHGDSHHLVSLVSTTYGYDSLLLLDPQPQLTTDGSADENLVKSPTTVINAWELMDGLLDNEETQERRRRQELFFTVKEKPKPLWKHLSEESLLAEMDPSVASTLRRRIPPIPDPNSSESTASGRGTEQIQNQQEPSIDNNNKKKNKQKNKQKVVLYTTTLRGIRRTYEDCCIVRTILKGIRVAVDEKDVSMDSGYRNELNRLLGGEPMALPRVFIGESFIGGVDEVRQMNESGELKRFLDGFDIAMEDGDDSVEVVCCGCGGVRFVLCTGCGGSRKVFVEEEGQVKRCSVCNENGLVRCPYCCCF